MIQPDMFTSFAISGAASLFGLLMCFAVRADQARVGYALTLYRWGFLFSAPILLASLAPADRVHLVFQAAQGCTAMGLVLLGWASRQLQGRRTPPWLGWGLMSFVGLALWLSAWGLSQADYARVLYATLSLICLTVLLEQAWAIVRGARISVSEWGLLAMLTGLVANWSIHLVRALSGPAEGTPDGPWTQIPDWWGLPSAMVVAIWPLAWFGVVVATLNERLQQQLHTRALSDELTGALSRRGLRELGERMILACRRPYDQLAVLMLDVDHFKRVNETYGHLVGDDVLRHVVQVVQDRLRDDALLARYSGEEFVVLLPIRQPHEAKVVAERLRSSIEAKPAQTTAGLVRLTLSVGVAYHHPSETLEHALAMAEASLAQAKEAGRNQVALSLPEEAVDTMPPASEVVHS